jgi:hypothetical protein
MASKARVELSAAKPTITTSSARIRATFSAGKAVAAVTINRPALVAGRVSAAVDTQVTIPSALLKWVSIVFAVDVDTIGRNPILKDVFAVADAVDVRAEKHLNDLLVTSEDTFLLIFKKGNLEPLTTAEAKRFDIDKPLSDTVGVTDDFYGQANIDDDQTMVLSKTLPAEFNTVSDNTVVTAGKGLAEALFTADQIGPFFIGKAASDGIYLTEVRSVSFSKELSDSVDAGDEMNAAVMTDDGEVMVFGKNLADSFLVGDSSFVEAGKGLSESVGSLDELQPFVLGKGITDTGVTSESRQHDISKPLSDASTQTDSASVEFAPAPINERRYATDGPAADITYAVYGYFGEDYVYEYFPAKVFFKNKTEALSFSDTVAIATQFNRSFAEAQSAADLKVFSLSKSFSESVTKTDSVAQSFAKASNDQTTTSDTRLKDFSKLISDVVHPTDDFYGVANADDDETMSYSKMSTDLISSSDLCVFSASKSLADTVSKSDLKVFDLSKSLSDSFTKSDAATKSAGKALSDSFSKADASTILVGKANSDSASTSESQTRFVGKALSDAATKSDLATRDISKPLADSFSKSDSVSSTAGKGLTDSATTGETKTFAISKSLADTVHPTDAYHHLAVSDDDENMLFGKISNDVVLKSDSSTIAAGKALADSVGKSDSGSLVWTDYWDINYTVTSSGVYVGNSQTF